MWVFVATLFTVFSVFIEVLPELSSGFRSSLQVIEIPLQVLFAFLWLNFAHSSFPWKILFDVSADSFWDTSFEILLEFLSGFSLNSLGVLYQILIALTWCSSFSLVVLCVIIEFSWSCMIEIVFQHSLQILIVFFSSFVSSVCAVLKTSLSLLRVLLDC